MEYFRRSKHRVRMVLIRLTLLLTILLALSACTPARLVVSGTTKAIYAPVKAIF